MEMPLGRNGTGALPEKGYRFSLPFAKAKASAKARKALIFWPQQSYRQLDADYFTGRLYINENSNP